MHEQTKPQMFDFTTSFKKSLERFDRLSSSRKADYERASVKERQAAPDGGTALAHADE